MKKDNSSIYEAIYDIVRQIPKGRVTSYGAIAKSIGVTSGARLVGYALGNIPLESNVPAHRVLNRNGLLTGKHHFGEDVMRQRLEAEGIIIYEDKVIEWNSLFWDPFTEILIS